MREERREQRVTSWVVETSVNVKSEQSDKILFHRSLGRL